MQLGNTLHSLSRLHLHWPSLFQFEAMEVPVTGAISPQIALYTGSIQSLDWSGGLVETVPELVPRQMCWCALIRIITRPIGIVSKDSAGKAKKAPEYTIVLAVEVAERRLMPYKYTYLRKVLTAIRSILRVLVLHFLCVPACYVCFKYSVSTYEYYS